MAARKSIGTATFYDEDPARNGGFGLVIWGFATVAAVVLGFASWQFAPPRAEGDGVRMAGGPNADEITGSIVPGDKPAPLPSRVIAPGKVGPLVLGADPNEPAVTIRDIEVLRADLRELQRRIAQMGLSGDGMSRRVDRLEERITVLASSVPSQPSGGETFAAREDAGSAQAAGQAMRTAGGPAEASANPRLPQPRPDVDQPTVTGSVPPKAATTGSAGKLDREATPAAPAPQPVAAAAPVPAPTPAAVAAPSPTSAPAEAAKAQPVGGAAVAAIDLGGYRSLASLKKSWSDMSDRYSEFGHGIEPLARLRETDSGMEARLVAGPYSSQQEAAKACIRMKAFGVACQVTGYTGQPLAAIR